MRQAATEQLHDVGKREHAARMNKMSERDRNAASS
jgi:hypothetical protein